MTEWRKYATDQDFFKHETPETFYVAGFIAADGCLTHDTGTMLNITLKGEDIGHLVKIKTVMKSEHPITTRVNKDSLRNTKYKDSIGCMLRITSKIIAQDLGERFGIGPRKSQTYAFPQQIKNHSLLHYFLLGYFDGDGSIGFDKPRLREKQGTARVHIRGTKDFLTGFHRAVLDYTDADVKEDKVIGHDSGIGSLQYTGNKSVGHILDYLYTNPIMYLDRKYERYKQLCEIRGVSSE